MHIVSDYLFNTDILVTSILHDVIEDTVMTKKMIETIFGTLIANNVESLTRIKLNQKISSTDTIRLLSNQKKEDLLLVKYFDRLHNLQTLEIKSPMKQKEIILETLKEFLPIAAHFGILAPEQQLSKICANINFTLQGINSKEKHVFSFEDNDQHLFLAFQNEKY